MASSSVYILNDIIDRKKDSLHPRKKERPIACGKISVRSGMLLSNALFLVSEGIALTVNPESAAVILAFIVLNIVYSLILKKQPFIDVMVIAAGFLLRIVAGAAAIHVDLSRWMLLTTFFLALFLGFSKRRSEIIITKGSDASRSVLHFYSLELMNNLINISASLTIITYSLYVILSESMKKLGADRFIFTIPFVVFGIFRYLYLVYQQKDGADPAEILLQDKTIVITVLLWSVLIISFLVLAFLEGSCI
jgi:4-hydroxybenzoate polyprenyltransferase